MFEVPNKICFTICISIPFGLLVLVSIPVGINVIPWLIGLYLFCGALIAGLIVPVGVPIGIRLKLIPLWILAIWSEHVRGWVLGD